MTPTAKNYGDALYELARDEGLSDELLPQLKSIRRLLQEEKDYVRLLCAANIPLSERLQVLDDAFRGRVHSYVLSFLKLLCERGHIRELPTCVDRYRARYNDEHGILEAVAVTARALRPEQRAKLAERLGGITGKKVDVHNRVDSSILGGIRLEYAGVELDGSVRQRLDGLRKSLSEIVL